MSEGRAARFDWDAGNIDHIAEHGVEPEEAEEALLDRRRISDDAYELEGERRRSYIGATDAGRILFVVITERRGQVRVVTARDASERNKRRYRRRGR